MIHQKLKAKHRSLKDWTTVVNLFKDLLQQHFQSLFVSEEGAVPDGDHLIQSDEAEHAAGTEKTVASRGKRSRHSAGSTAALETEPNSCIERNKTSPELAPIKRSRRSRGDEENEEIETGLSAEDKV